MRNILAAAFLVIATLIVYAQISSHFFVSYDDGSYVYANPHVSQGLSVENLGWAFRSTEQANWHPLTWISHMLDSHLYGVGTDASGMHHLTSLLIHLFNTLLMFFVFQRMTSAFWPSLFVAAAFALHPQHVESVAWVAERKDVLSQFFWLLCIASYVEFSRGARRKWLWVSSVLLALGLMSKPMLVTAPFLFLLLDVWPLRRLQMEGLSWASLRPRLVEKIPMFFLVGISCVITYWVQQAGGAVQEYPISHKVATVLTGYARYVGKALVPIDLAILYPNHVGMWQGWQIALALAALLGISAGVYRLRARPYLAVGWLWFLGTLVPVVGIVSVGALSMADRYTYMPLTGLVVMIAWGAADLCEARPVWRKPIGTLAILILGAWMMLSFQQVKTWRDGLTLYRHALEVTEENPIMHSNYSGMLLIAERIEESIVHAREAVRLDPSHASAYINLGHALFKTGDAQGALENYRQAIQAEPESIAGYLSLASLLRSEGELEQALVQYERALAIQPDSAEVHRNIGATYLMRGETTPGMEALQKAETLNPNLPGLPFQIGKAMYAQGKFEEAVTYLQRSVQRDPDSLEAYRTLGMSLLASGRHQEALASFQRAVEIDPDDLESLKNLGVGLVVLGKPAEARGHLEHAVQIASGDAVVYFNLASGLRALGELDQAIVNYRKATEMDPGYVVAYIDWGRVLREQGNLLEAIEIAQVGVQASPESAAMQNSLGISLASVGKMNEAIRSFRRAVELDPDLADAQANLRRAESILSP